MQSSNSQIPCVVIKPAERRQNLRETGMSRTFITIRGVRVAGGGESKFRTGTSFKTRFAGARADIRAQYSNVGEHLSF